MTNTQDYDPIESRDVRVHPTIDELIRLRFAAKQISLLPRQPVDSLLSGQHASRLRGRGFTFEELRRYRPGDDIRSIDWRATARLRSTHVRVYSEERDRPVLLVVDQRSGMYFGSARTTKATAAADLAALAAWRVVDAGDRVGAIIFNEEDSVQIKPQRSQSTVLQICHQLVEYNQRLSVDRDLGDGSALNDALRWATNVAHHDHLVLLITDYHGDDEETRELTTHLAAHNDVLAVLVYDPLGASLSASGPMQATDGQRQVSVPSDARFTQRFEDQFRERCRQVKDRLSAVRIPILPICTHDSVTDQLQQALGGRS